LQQQLPAQLPIYLTIGKIYLNFRFEVFPSTLLTVLPKTASIGTALLLGSGEPALTITQKEQHKA
jgi:hypothetical protein